MRWEVEKTDAGWAVNGYSNEFMRIRADGTLMFGGNQPIESYPYTTKEWAEVGRKYAKRLDPECDPIELVYVKEPIYGTNPPSHSARIEFTASNLGRVVFQAATEGEIVKFDLPFFVWVWLRNTGVFKGLRRFWYGERHDQ